MASIRPQGWPRVDWINGHLHPSLQVEELTSAAIFVLALAHALSQRAGGARRVHLLLLLCAILGGIGSDIVFAYLDFVDNFWHAQATVMIYERLPLHIVLFYVGWYYMPMALAWRLELPPLAEMTFVSVMCLAFYWPWDVIGVRMMWWTWHQSDSSFDERYLHVPVASTSFVLLQGLIWARLVRLGLGVDVRAQFSGSPSPATMLRTALACFFVVPCLLVLFPLSVSLSSQVPLGSPATVLSTKVTGAVILVCMLWSASRGIDFQRRAPCKSGWLLYAMAALRIGSCFTHLMWTEPRKQLSYGVHQTVGPCDERQDDMTGSRMRYLCKDGPRRFEVSYGCMGEGRDHFPPSGSSHYTVCGAEKGSIWSVRALVLMLVCACAFFVVAVLDAIRQSTPPVRPKRGDNDEGDDEGEDEGAAPEEESKKVK